MVLKWQSKLCYVFCMEMWELVCGFHHRSMRNLWLELHDIAFCTLFQMLPLHHIDSMAERGLQVVWFSAKVDLCDPLHANNSQFHFRLAKPSSMHCKLYLKKVWLSANSVRGSMLVWERCNRGVCRRFCLNLTALLHCNCLWARIFLRGAGMWRFVWHGWNPKWLLENSRSSTERELRMLLTCSQSAWARKTSYVIVQA